MSDELKCHASDEFQTANLRRTPYLQWRKHTPRPIDPALEAARQRARERKAASEELDRVEMLKRVKSQRLAELVAEAKADLARINAQRRADERREREGYTPL